MQLSDQHKKVLQDFTFRRQLAEDRVKMYQELLSSALRERDTLTHSMEALVFVIAGEGAELNTESWTIHWPDKSE